MVQFWQQASLPQRSRSALFGATERQTLGSQATDSMIRDLVLATLAAFATLVVGSFPIVVLPTFFTSEITRVSSTYVMSIPMFTIPAFCFSAVYLLTPVEHRTVKRGFLLGLLIGVLLSAFLGFHRSFPREVAGYEMPLWPLVVVYSWHIALWVLAGGAVASVTRRPSQLAA